MASVASANVLPSTTSLVLSTVSPPPVGKQGLSPVRSCSSTWGQQNESLGNLICLPLAHMLPKHLLNQGAARGHPCPTEMNRVSDDSHSRY